MSDEANSNEYFGPERRRPPKALQELEAVMLHMFADHEEREREMNAEMRKEFLAAFPNEDTAGHCAYHSAKIKAAQAEEKFWETARSIALQHGIAGVFAALKWIAVLSILGLAYKIGLGPAAAKLLGVP